MASNFGLSLGLCMVYLAWSFPTPRVSPDLVEPCMCEMCEALNSICRAVVGRKGGKGRRGLWNEMATVARISPKTESLDEEHLRGTSPWRQIKDEVSTTPLLHGGPWLVALLCPESLREDQGMDSKGQSPLQVALSWTLQNLKGLCFWVLCPLKTKRVLW